jgi:hypothetical protein
MTGFGCKSQILSGELLFQRGVAQIGVYIVDLLSRSMR